MKRNFIIGLFIAFCSLAMLFGLSGCLSSSSGLVPPTQTSENINTHTHEWIQIITKQERTCVNYGIYWRKCACGFGEDYVASPKGHNYQIIEALEPTCTEEGHTAGKYCTDCDEREGLVLPALGHRGGTNICTQDSICTRCGLPYRNPYGHNLVNYEAKAATCTEKGWGKYQVCTRCNYSTKTLIDELGHNFVDDTCTVCGAEKAESLSFVINADGVSYRINGIGTFNKEHLEIPATYKGLPVTAIGVNAFSNCDNLVSVVIPYGIKTIGDRAFYNCDKLVSISIPNSVTSIGEYAFTYTSIKNIVIPDSVTSLDSWAFNSCSKLESVVIGNSLTYIPYFSSCSNLNSITIGKSVNKIYEDSLWGCPLTNVTFLEKSGWQICVDGVWTDVTDVIWNNQEVLCEYVRHYQWRRAYVFLVVDGDGNPITDAQVKIETDQKTYSYTTVDSNGRRTLTEIVGNIVKITVKGTLAGQSFTMEFDCKDKMETSPQIYTITITYNA